jgi:hypothetical protein
MIMFQLTLGAKDTINDHVPLCAWDPGAGSTILGSCASGPGDFGSLTAAPGYRQVHVADNFVQASAS